MKSSSIDMWSFNFSPEEWILLRITKHRLAAKQGVPTSDQVIEIAAG